MPSPGMTTRRLRRPRQALQLDTYNAFARLYNWTLTMPSPGFTTGRLQCPRQALQLDAYDGAPRPLCPGHDRAPPIARRAYSALFTSRAPL